MVCFSLAAGICCFTIAFSPLCLWRIRLSEWEPSWTISTAVCLSTTLQAAGCWVPSGSASPSPATRLWGWSSRAACSCAWCRSCPNLQKTASPATLLTLKKKFTEDVELFDCFLFIKWNDHGCRGNPENMMWCFCLYDLIFRIACLGKKTLITTSKLFFSDLKK